MRTVIAALALAIVLAGSFIGVRTAEGAPAQRGQSPQVPAPVPAPAPAPPLPPVLPEEVATPRQLVNIRVDLVVIEEGAGEPIRRKEVSLLLADRRSGSVRAGGFPVPDKPVPPLAPPPPDDKFRPPAFTEPTLRVDVLPWLERDGKIRTLVTMRYLSSPHFPREGEQKVEPLLESGKTMVVSQTSSAISDRKMRVEVTATILK
jgi:hypothetical protein